MADLAQLLPAHNPDNPEDAKHYGNPKRRKVKNRKYLRALKKEEVRKKRQENHLKKATKHANNALTSTLHNVVREKTGNGGKETTNPKETERNQKMKKELTLTEMERTALAKQKEAELRYAR